MDCYVLDTGERVISLRAAVKALADADHSKLGDYVGTQALKPFIDKDLVLGETVDYFIPGTQFEGKGISAEQFLEICNAYVKALEAGALTTERQREVAVRCAILLAACAKVGLLALIDPRRAAPAVWTWVAGGGGFGGGQSPEIEVPNRPWPLSMAQSTLTTSA